jgi:hypothetical protein
MLLKVLRSGQFWSSEAESVNLSVCGFDLLRAYPPVGGAAAGQESRVLSMSFVNRSVFVLTIGHLWL